MSLIGTCSDCGTGGVSLRYKPGLPVNEQSRPSICDRCRDFREEQATHYVPCEKCGDRLPSERAKSLDVTAEDEYYPEFIHFCPACAPDETDDEPELATDGGTELGVLCDVDDCDSRIVGLDDGWEFSRGTVCQDCIDYHDRHGHWPDESVDICAECRIDDGLVPHECEECAADRVLIEPGTTCDYCGFEAAMTDGGKPAEDGQAIVHTDGYVDAREFLPGHFRRICVDCGHEWWAKSGYAERPCPECENDSSFRELAPEYAEKWAFFDGEDYGIKPEPWYWPLLEDMARELEDELGYDVNPLTCKDYILAALPEDHERHETLEERREMYA